MKLTHEGAARLGRHEAQGFPVCDFEFQPEDFKGGCFQNGKGHVVLTVEEAKILLECACCVDAYTFAKCKKLFDCLKTRIELVEKCDA